LKYRIMGKSAKKLSFKVLLTLVLASTGAFAQKNALSTDLNHRDDLNHRELRWTSPITTQFTETETKSFLWFDGASYDAEKDFLPLFYERQKLSNGSTTATAQITNAQYVPLDAASLQVIGSSSAF